MGIANSTERIYGIDASGRNITLQQILDKNKDLEHMLKYTRKFRDHHMELQGKETNYQTEIFY